MIKLTYLVLISFVGLATISCSEPEEMIEICAKGKIVDYNCGRNAVVQVITPNIKLGIKARINNTTTELENVIQINNLPAAFNQPGEEFYFTFRLAKEDEKDTGICPAIYTPYNVPQVMVKNVSELPCDDDDWDDWD